MNKIQQRRFNKTLNFLRNHIDSKSVILDLGTPNDFSEGLKLEGYTVFNTAGEDLDINPETVNKFKDIQVVTAFEIFEHLINPLSVLQQLPANKLVASIPLSLWFAKAYRNKNDEWDQHFHEFEDWQFDLLLKKSGWNIIAREKWTSPTGKIGFRPFLRKITPRYYIVYAEKE